MHSNTKDERSEHATKTTSDFNGAVAIAFTCRHGFAGSCSWSNKEVLSQTTGGQPGLTVFGGKLYLAYIGTSQNDISVESAADGFTFQNQVILSSMRSNLGVGLGSSDNTPNSCSQIFLGYVGTDSNSTLNFAASSDGINWSSQVTTYSSATATPQFGNLDSQVQYTFSQWNVYSSDPWAAIASFRCPGVNSNNDLSYWLFNGCPSGNPGCGGNSTGSVGFSEQLIYYNNEELGPFFIKSLAEPGATSTWPIEYAVSGMTGRAYLGENWSTSGDTATMIPNYPHPDYYLAWKGSGGYLNIAHVDYYGNFLAQDQCSDWSTSTPAIAYFNGLLFVAWRGGNNQINVASLRPF